MFLRHGAPEGRHVSRQARGADVHETPINPAFYFNLENAFDNYRQIEMRIPHPNPGKIRGLCSRRVPVKFGRLYTLQTSPGRRL